MIDTTDTRYAFKSWAPGVWAFGGWEAFLRSLDLNCLDDFIQLRGQVVDRNRKSRVHRISLGSPARTCYLKLHRGYVKRSWRSLFRPRILVERELANLMHYARAGFDALEPVAWGRRLRKRGGESFLLVAELEGYRSLQEWLSNRGLASDSSGRRSLRESVARMLARMHQAGLAHIDLFSWHIFLKPQGDAFLALPIDLERSRIKGPWPWSSRRILEKQAHDLAVLHLTVPWPQVGYRERMRFFLHYRGHQALSRNDKRLLRKVLAIARHRGRQKKFKPFGVAERLSPVS
ncbi:MAG: hypothetical protein GY849_16785 [Deltaproteobacteria bacterium]|nr:hypothetical protein [Deltaproteobacteria bacterium]